MLFLTGAVSERRTSKRQKERRRQQSCLLDPVAPGKPEGKLWSRSPRKQTSH